MQNKGSLHNKFEGFGVQPSEKLWDSIASGLDQKKKKRAIIFWWLGSGLAAILCVIIGVNYGIGTNDLKITEHKLETPTKINNSESSNQDITIEETKEKIINVISNSVANNPKEQTQTFNITDKQNTATNKNQFEKSKTVNTYDSDYSIKVDPKTIIVVKKDKQSTLAIKKINIPLCDAVHIDKNGIIGTSVINQAKPKSNWIFSFKVQSQKGFELSQPYSAAETANTNTSGVAFDLFSEQLNTKTFRPITVRFGVAKKLNSRFSFQTGIDLGWIQTNSALSKSSLFTVGLPLKLNLSLIERKRGTFYTDFGLVNELPFLERIQTLGQSSYGLNESKIVSGFLGGTQVGLGFNYKLNERFKFDVNSGFKWYYYQGLNSGTPIASQNAFVTFNAGVIWNY